MFHLIPHVLKHTKNLLFIHTTRTVVVSIGNQLGAVTVTGTASATKVYSKPILKNAGLVCGTVVGVKALDKDGPIMTMLKKLKLKGN